MNVAICLPIHSGAQPLFVSSLARMIARTLTTRVVDLSGNPQKLILETFVYSCSNVAFARRALVDRALTWGADWLLWIDSDQTFPPNTLLRLLAHQKPFVGVNCRRRTPDQVLPTAHVEVDGKFVPVLPEGDDLQEVAYFGMAVCLTHKDVYARIEEPFFYDEIRSDGLYFIGEDVNFCHKARNAGFPILVDNKLSREIGHLATINLVFPQDSEAAS